MEWNEQYIWVLVIGFLGTAFLISYLYEKKRTAALQQEAQRLGFHFSKDGLEETCAKHSVFDLFSRGHSQKIKNEMSKVEGDKTFRIFGFQYTQGSGKNSTTYRQTVVSVQSEKLALPTFQIVPEKFYHRIGEVFGYQDIDFEPYPDFSKKYLLRGNNEAAISDVFTPSLMSYFESNDDIYMEAVNDTVIYYTRSKRCKPQDIEQFYYKGQEAFNALVS